MSTSIELIKHPEIIGRSVNDYSFTKELINAVNNVNFKKDTYYTLSGTNDTEYSYIWSAISNITETQTNFNADYYNEYEISSYTENTPTLLYQNITEAFEDNILNYIDNISNVDICKIKSLQSMILQLGISYTIFDKLKLMPILILNILDVLSIKKEYLINSDKIKKIFATLLYAEISSDISIATDLSTTVSSLTDCRMSSIITTDTEEYYLSTNLDKINVDASAYIDNNKLYNFTSAIYKNILSDFCNLRYNNKNIKIYTTLSDSILLSDFSLVNTNKDLVAELNTFRLKYNIPNTFNEVIEVDKIENGLTTYDDYSVYELSLITTEEEYRKQPLNAALLYSRNYYYRLKTVKDFFKFIENEYANDLSLYLNTKQYNIDNSYLVVTNNNNPNNLLKLYNGQLYIDSTMIDYVAKVLADITESIRDIREQIKTQVQKNFLKGTKIHIEYIIREYIRNNIYPTYKKIANSFNFKLSNINDYNISDVLININEYTDPTEYFNISTNVDTLSDNTNLRFWESNSTIHGIAPFNTNNIFKKPNILNSATFLNFKYDDISSLYFLKLQMLFYNNINIRNTSQYNKIQTLNLNNFLSNVYNSGADTTYLDNNGNICCNLDFINLNDVEYVLKISDLPKLQSDIVIGNIEKILNAAYNNISIGNELKSKLSSIAELSNITTDISSIALSTYNNIINSVYNVLKLTNNTLDKLDIKNCELNTSISAINWRAYKNRLFNKYTGLSNGEYSFYNIKNKRHPSYQIHPYIKNFVNSEYFEYPIENIANIITEKITSKLINDISCYVDDLGYIKNVWNNNLNTNSDYLSEYEKSSNKTPYGTVSKQIDYDGIFYPEALNDFLTNTSLFISEVLSTDTKTNTKICCNKWYKDLNLSENELSNILDQLHLLADYINIEANSTHDIYRYGKDFYGNIYILTKDFSAATINDNINIDDNVKRTTPGVVWMRLKNHPIAFPMIYQGITNSAGIIDENIQRYSLIKYINDDYQQIKSITEFDNTTAFSIDSHGESLKTPKVYDFTISKDRTELMFLCEHKTSTRTNLKLYVIHTNIKKIFYRNIEKRYKYHFILDNFNNNIKGVTTTTTIPIDDGYTFNSFYNFNTYLGIVEVSSIVNNNTLYCNIKLPYWNKYDLESVPVQNQLTGVLICENCASNALTDYKIDITNKKRISIAYRNNIISNTDIELSDSLGKKVFYPGNSLLTNNRLNILASSLTTKEWRFDAKQISEIDFKRDYLSYNDMGYIPVYELKSTDTHYELNYINDIVTNTQSGKQWFIDDFIGKGQLKINLVGKPKTVTNNDYGIFFKHVVPIRMHELYKLKSFDNKFPDKYLLTADTPLCIANYFDAHYSEVSDEYVKTITENIYDPYEFEQAIQYSNLCVRIDESYLNIFLNSEFKAIHPNVTKQYLDKFNDIPYYYKVGNGKEFEDCVELYNPGSEELNAINRKQLSVSNQDTYIINISADNLDIATDIDQISVAWIKQNDNKYGSKKGIKLDFNTAYYNYNPETYSNGSKRLSANYFNWKHSFLNLDKPGDSGYLQIWKDDTVTKFSKPGNIYFIKNISDDKPRFIISPITYSYDNSIESAFYIAMDNDIDYNDNIISNLTYTNSFGITHNIVGTRKYKIKNIN